MKGQLLKSKALTDEWMVRYTTYKTIPGIKGVMGSHSRMPESNYTKMVKYAKLINEEKHTKRSNQ
jgi:hypothetical protein